MKKTAIKQAIAYLQAHNLLSAAIILEHKFLDIERDKLSEAYWRGVKHASEMFEIAKTHPALKSPMSKADFDNLEKEVYKLLKSETPESLKEWINQQR